MKVLSVIGARPQFIKAFVVSRQIRSKNEEILVHTGQHYDDEMSDVFFDELGIPEPDHNLGIGSKSHGEQTAEMIIGLEDLIERHTPDVVLCYGDTNSTLAAAIVASKMDVELAHVEAGLRSFNREMPEETNRVLTDHASDILFAPSERAVSNLDTEGISTDVYSVGDVMYDSLLWARDKADSISTIREDLDIEEKAYILSTVHRPRNTDNPDRLRDIIQTLVSESRPVVFPAHPRTVKQLEKYDLYDVAESELILTEPLGYLDFVSLQAGADIIVTDSGGIQKEAFFLDVPCVTLREETEWTETVECGSNVLVGADTEKLEDALANPPISDTDAQPYGDGDAAEKIVNRLASLI
jgi:UDP-N-acetylglucosamine 2-epimerase (non-hydrolysing)